MGICIQYLEPTKHGNAFGEIIKMCDVSMALFILVQWLCFFFLFQFDDLAPPPREGGGSGNCHILAPNLQLLWFPPFALFLRRHVSS